MSVLQCNRKNCDNVMCERLSYEHGYICWECFDELVSKGPEANTEDFMNSPKRVGREEAAKARFDVEFPRSR